jgi:hypothetical protein
MHVAALWRLPVKSQRGESSIPSSGSQIIRPLVPAQRDPMDLVALDQ